MIKDAVIHEFPIIDAKPDEAWVPPAGWVPLLPDEHSWRRGNADIWGSWCIEPKPWTSPHSGRVFYSPASVVFSGADQRCWLITGAQFKYHIDEMDVERATLMCALLQSQVYLHILVGDMPQFGPMPGVHLVEDVTRQYVAQPGPMDPESRREISKEEAARPTSEPVPIETVDWRTRTVVHGFYEDTFGHPLIDGRLCRPIPVPPRQHWQFNIEFHAHNDEAKNGTSLAKMLSEPIGRRMISLVVYGVWCKDRE